MSPAEYKAIQDRVELLSRLILDTDAAALDAFATVGEGADSVGAFLDPTAWMRGHDKLRMVIDHARAIASARRLIVAAAKRAGEPVA